MLKVIFLLLAFSTTLNASSSKVRITFEATANGSGLVYEIDKSTIKSLPKWNVGLNNPPLSIKSAILKSQKEIEKLNIKQKMKFSGIRLSSASVIGKHTVWYYSVTFLNDATHRSQGYLSKTIHLLMNGNIIRSREMSKEEYGQWFG